MTKPYAIRLPAVDGAPAIDVRVMTPQGERPEGGWPVLVLLEGEAFFDAAAQVAGRLLRRSAKTRVDAMMVAGVTLSVVTDRVAAYAFTPGPQGQTPEPRGAALLAQLTTQVLPRLAELGADPAQSVLMGHSMSGLFVLEARAARAPFARHVAVSPSIWWNPAVIAAQPQTQPGTQDDLLIAVGAREEMDGLPLAHLGRRMISNARDLTARGGVSLRVFEDEDHGSTPYAALPSILRFAAPYRG
ncbi:alpha/beta hydrolase [Brevundimonas diminuta]|uniref:alpha/beta hydrolase n=1 Tax=Brevundimonas diminuta TaxID=293 RepID=UPI003D02CF78